MREGMDGLLKWLEDSDFYSAPASTKYHDSCPGGLVSHSLRVYDEFKRISAAYPEISVSEESAVIVTLFHDLCKVNFYGVEKRNRKNEAGKWESYDAYSVSERFCYGGHGSKSVYLVQYFMKLTPDEAVAINCHMGARDPNNDYVDRAYEQCHLAWLLHIADEAATYLKKE